jgi:hypothetical protein
MVWSAVGYNVYWQTEWSVLQISTDIQLPVMNHTQLYVETQQSIQVQYYERMD